MAINFYYQKIFSFYTLKNEIIIEIPKGTNLNKITKILLKKKIIQEGFFFKSWVKFNGLEKKLKAGEYLIENKINLNNLMHKLVNGKSIVHFLRIDDGVSKYALSKKIKKDIPRVREFSHSFLPDNIISDTYGYTINDSLESLIKNFVIISNARANDIWMRRDKKIPLKSIDDLFIIASIIEKETGKKGEKKTIAGVFYNRLKKNMRLQSDPTVIFSLTNGGDFNRELTKNDLKNKSIYNTYVVKGLPPSPICYPSLSSLEAAAKPENTSFLYFVADGSGGHFFAKSYKEHLRNIKKFKNAKKKKIE